MAKAKKTQKAAEPRIMNGHLVKEAKAPLYKVKHAKGDQALPTQRQKNQGHACKKHYRLFEGAAEDG